MHNITFIELLKESDTSSVFKVETKGKLCVLKVVCFAAILPVAYRAIDNHHSIAHHEQQELVDRMASSMGPSSKKQRIRMSQGKRPVQAKKGSSKETSTRTNINDQWNVHLQRFKKDTSPPKCQCHPPGIHPCTVSF